MEKNKKIETMEREKYFQKILPVNKYYYIYNYIDIIYFNKMVKK